MQPTNPSSPASSKDMQNYDASLIIRDFSNVLDSETRKGLEKKAQEFLSDIKNVDTLEGLDGVIEKIKKISQIEFKKVTETVAEVHLMRESHPQKAIVKMFEDMRAKTQLFSKHQERQNMSKSFQKVWTLFSSAASKDHPKTTQEMNEYVNQTYKNADSLLNSSISSYSSNKVPFMVAADRAMQMRYLLEMLNKEVISFIDAKTPKSIEVESKQQELLQILKTNIGDIQISFSVLVQSMQTFEFINKQDIQTKAHLLDEHKELLRQQSWESKHGGITPREFESKIANFRNASAAPKIEAAPAVKP